MTLLVVVVVVDTIQYPLHWLYSSLHKSAPFTSYLMSYKSTCHIQI